ncbi:uncharacterized protein LOC127880247 isoform X2 [Dreissena polymorpha]|uniref:Uncharacterized protein n=1 Tax=Dreissena polymorpha TaxID=45954 RepID=A0A9D4KKJ4_DREPO|nr:uncharacterized protein LOC127879428 isoform X2 [Dreissena polymorpha]XP_052283523.1 uncharacterized protein LOC127880247 isoform X2 [Dreissena polymorpha]KAH3841174.1 hypothetical protein DPMN_114632 [Dreissena polymorpha]
MNTVYCWFDWDDNTTTVNSINIIKEPRKPWMEYKTGEKVLAKLPQFGLWRGVIVEISESKKDLVQKMTTRQKNAAALVSNDDVQNEADDDDNGTNEDNLAQKITSDFGVLKNKIPEENKRKPKRKIMDDFVESEEHVSTKTGKSTSKGKVTKVKDTARIGEEKPGKEKTEKKKTDKEEVIKERKEKENSRMATMTNCASFILDTIACSQTQTLDKAVRRKVIGDMRSL